MLGSLILGLIAWILPIISIICFKKVNNMNWTLLSVLSLGACAISLYFQIYYNDYLVKIWDASALMDTIGASSFLSAVMLVITIILNAINMYIFHKQENR